MKKENTSIFSAIQEKFNIVEVAQNLGLFVKKIGSTFRSDSIDTSGRGENALALYEETNSWYDFMLNIGGDIADLVARVKFDGDIKQAISFLMPDAANFIDRDLKARKSFEDNVERWHHCLINPDDKYNPHQRRALDYLHSRGINDETIKALKIGVMPDGCCSYRIIFPYWDDCGKKILYFTSRRYDHSGKGEFEYEPKYKKASLEQFPFLHNSPLGLNSLIRLKGDTLIITEGIVDWLVFYQEGYSVLSPAGGDFGKMWKDVLDRIKNFKKVILAFDNDQAGQEFTCKSAKILLSHRIPFYCVNMLTKDVAEHYALTGNLDAIFNSLQKGISWLLNYVTPKTPLSELSVGEREEALASCRNFIMDIAPFSDKADIREIILGLRSYFPLAWIEDIFEMARKGPSQLEIANKVCANHSLLFNSRTGFYEYQSEKKRGSEEGIWKRVDDEVVLGYIKDKLGRFATGGKLASTLKLIQADSEVYSDYPINTFNTLPLISFLNGTLHIDLSTGVCSLKPHSMFDYVTVRLPYALDFKAKCPLWEKFIDEITNGRKDDQAVLQEFAGYILSPHCKFQKALMLKGGGSNGKSVFFNIISTLFGGTGADGRGYVSSTEPSKWAKDFRLMPLRHSWVNIASDAEYDMRGAEGTFKKVVAGEVLEDSYKYKDPIPFNTRSKLMMACNFFPTINDTSDGFMRRWLIVELDSHFVEKDKVRPYSHDKVLDPFLEDKLMQELPGIFNWLLRGLARLLKKGQFTHTANHDRLINEFRAANDPLYSFVEEKEELLDGSDQGHIIPRSTVFGWFKEWANHNDIDPIPANRFHSNIRSVFHNLGLPFDEDGDSWIFYTKEVDFPEMPDE